MELPASCASGRYCIVHQRYHDRRVRSIGPRLRRPGGSVIIVQQPCILIPAYKPDDKLVTLVRQLLAAGFSDLLIVDDGSGEACRDLFRQCAALGGTILHHGINMGKGRALKTGLNHYLVRGGPRNGIVTADADGQHTPADIRRIAEAMAAHPDTFVLGVRQFTGNVPLRSRFGNGVTRRVFAMINGETVTDTQTGLRGLPDAQIPLFLTLSGERYEYEMNMLLAIRPHDLRIFQVPIETIYIEGNKSSHYNAIRDSARIYKLIFLFTLSSIAAAAIDYAVFIPMTLRFPGQLLLSVFTARAISSLANYLMNDRLVFRQKHAPRLAIVRYYILVLVNLTINYAILWLLSSVIGLNLYVAKIITDIFLYIINFRFQRDFVYRRRPKPDAGI